jgi:hypothetical protein
VVRPGCNDDKAPSTKADDPHTFVREKSGTPLAEVVEGVPVTRARPDQVSGDGLAYTVAQGVMWSLFSLVVSIYQTCLPTKFHHILFPEGHNKTDQTIFYLENI